MTRTAAWLSACSVKVNSKSGLASFCSSSARTAIVSPGAARKRTGRKGEAVGVDDVGQLIGETLTQSRLQPQYLELELTESFLLRDTERTVTTLDAMKALGIRLAIDDFGTGYSSLSYLTRLPVDELKIDRSFIAPLGNPDSEYPIVKAIVAMAHSLGLIVVAEGVETNSQLNALRALQCDIFQGYLFSKPFPADGLADVLSNWRDRLASKRAGADTTA